MDDLYVLVDDQCEWEDIQIYTKKEEAIEMSIRYPWVRLEIFSKKPGSSYRGYQPTYNYYQNGTYYNNGSK
jgi:hypothetical protein